MSGKILYVFFFNFIEGLKLWGESKELGYSYIYLYLDNLFKFNLGFCVNILIFD